MNTVNEQNSKKPLNFIVLMVVLIILAWSCTQVVKLFPSAVSSLASLADTVYTYEPNKKLEISLDRPNLASGENLVIWWNKEAKSGYFTFSYTCQDGVAIDLKTKDKDFTSIACNNSYDLGITDHVEVKIDSEKLNFTEVTFKVAYFKKNSDTPTTEQTKTVSVTNSNLIKDKTEETTTDNTKDKPTPTKPVVTTPKPTEPEITYTYEIPVSNPNGFTDLLLSNLKVGIKNNAGNFVETNSLNENKDGVVQFTIHNIGNKTSEDWIFTANLPDGIKYTSSTQKPLKPNERAIISVEFPAFKDADPQKISVRINTESDQNQNNNYIERIISVSN